MIIKKFIIQIVTMGRWHISMQYKILHGLSMENAVTTKYPKQKKKDAFLSKTGYANSCGGQQFILHFIG